MRITRQWPVEVVNKYEGPEGYLTITLRRHDDPMMRAPWWLDQDPQGAPLPLVVTREEYDQIQVGAVLLVLVAGPDQ